jgi:hypothetical protein
MRFRRNFYTNFQVDEIGRVVSVGDGIAYFNSDFHLLLQERARESSSTRSVLVGRPERKRCCIKDQWYPIAKSMCIQTT